MDIGEEKRVIIVEPMQAPMQPQEPEPMREPDRVPAEPERETEPASAEPEPART